MQHSGSIFEPLESRLLLDANPFLPSSDVPKAIPDQQTIVSTLAVSGQAGPVLDVEVQVDITHTWDSDLDVYLVSPSGTRVELFTDVGGAGDNFTGTILDDQAGTGIASGAAPFAGSYRPEGLLSALQGQDPNGIWQLEITDDAGGDMGTLNGWALRLTTTAVAQPQSVPYQQIFAAGKPGAAEGWEYYSTAEGRIAVVAGRLRMDDMFGNATASLNEAILHVNLMGRSNVQLTLDHVSLTDENTPLAASFTGHYNGDGIALSVDGVHWVKVTDLTGSFLGQSFGLDSVLQQAQAAAGSTNLSDVRIKFQQLDDYPSPEDGREFDNIRVEAVATTAPEIEVTGNGISIADGDTTPSATDYTDFGTIVQASPTISRTFTVRNNGTATLTLGAVTVPAGFTLTEGLSGSLAPGASDTFTVRLDNATVGTKSGDISFSTDDADENPFNFRITGTVNAVAENLALGRSAVASTTYAGYPAGNITDGNVNSRWSSLYSDNEWIYVDLGSVCTISQVVLQWTVAYARSYKLQVSNDASTWSDVYSTTAGVGGTESITLTSPASGRYIRLLGIQRATQWGYSLWEFEVYGGAPVNHAPVVSNFSKGGTQDVPLPFAPADFAAAFADPDAGNSLQKIRILSLPGHGVLTLGGTAVTVNQEVPVTQIGSLVYTPTGGYAGSDSFQWNGSDGSLYALSAAAVNLSINAAVANLALGRPAVASTTYPGYPAANATDGNANSYWSSAFADNQWIYVDLGAVQTINRVLVRWTVAYARSYKLQVSNDASTWTDVYSTTASAGGTEDITLASPASGRYVRLLGLQRATQWGVALYEFEVYGAGAGTPDITVLGNGVSITDGDTTPSTADDTDFGSVAQGGPAVIRTFTVGNSGTAPLLLGPVTVPAGFTLIEGLSAGLAAGLADTFTVQLDTAVPGVKSGDITFSTNDPDEAPFNFRITGTVVGVAPEITVLGNGISIADGDTTPSPTDHTDFGTLVQASPTISRTFTVYNGGNATLMLGAVTVPAGFTLTEGLSGSLAPGASDTFTVRLDNATLGIKSGDISFSTNDADENPFYFRITGVVAAAAIPEIDITGNGQPITDGDNTPSTIDNTDFGSVQVGNTAVRTFVIANSGSGALHLTGNPIVELLAGGGAFLVVQQPSALVGAGASTIFQIAYTPTAAALQSATVRIVNDDGNENPYEFAIQGTGTQAQAGWLASADVPKAIGDMQTIVSTLTVSGLAGPVLDVDVQVDISHTWDSDLNVYLISPSGTRVELFTGVGGSGDNLTDTILDDEAGVGIASGVAPFSGSYRPEGSLSALDGQNPNGTWRLEITDTAGGDTGTLNHWSLRITATAGPEVEVTGNGISIADGDTTPSATDYTDFGTIVQAAPTISRTFTVRNTGTATLTLGAVTVPAGFTLTEGLSASLTPGASDTFTVRLDNATVGTKSGDVSFSTNDADENPFNFRITGIVAAPAAGEIDVTGNGIPIADGDTTPSAADNTDFGSVQVGNTVARTFVITNSGTDILHLTGTPPVELVGGGGAFTVVQPVSVWVAAGASTTFQIVYTPAAAGVQSATVRIANDDSNENPYEFVIQGTGTQVQTGWLPSSDVPKAIGDLQTIASTLTVNGLAGPVADVDVRVNITHTWDSDLHVYLISPGGTRVELFTDVGSSGDNFTDTILDDEAGAGIASGAAPFSGSYRPEGLLSALDGQNPNGTWRLEITDDASGDTGTLNSWALRITTTAAQPQSVPYQQVFAAGKPGAAEGWEYYSTAEGRIEVVAGRLRMDDMLANTTSSLNEAILHVNLTGKTNVQLVLDHWTLSDENTPLATSFTGHYNGDGIALSVDGVHWVKVTDLTGSFIDQSFALDSVLQQAQVAAGSTNLSDVRIKFQQFDDNPSPDDGREFDNIRILTA